MKKYILASLLAFLVLVSFAHAETPTMADLQAFINRLAQAISNYSQLAQVVSPCLNPLLQPGDPGCIP